MSEIEQTLPSEKRSLWDSIKPYLEKESLAAFFVGVSSGFPFAMIAATLTTRLAQDGIEKSTITAFSLAFLVYNLKPLWAWIVDGVRLPVLGALGQRVSWMLVVGLFVIYRPIRFRQGQTRLGSVELVERDAVVDARLTLGSVEAGIRVAD